MSTYGLFEFNIDNFCLKAIACGDRQIAIVVGSHKYYPLLHFSLPGLYHFISIVSPCCGEKIRVFLVI